MTENEAKQWLKHTRAYQHKCDNCEYIDIKGACNEECKDFYDIAIQALSEIQQYRELGTVEHIKLTFELCKGLDCLVKMYEAIGTVDEFKDLKESELKCKDCAGCTNWKCDCANERDYAIDEFAERLKYSLANNYRHLLERDTDGFDWLTTDAVETHIEEIAEQMKVGGIDG